MLIMFYKTEGRCGSLLCGPYVDYRELSCARCSIATPGAIHTRWGHNACPGTSKTIFSGYVGSPHWSHSGGVCLFPFESALTGLPLTQQHTAEMYGTEFETNSNGIPSFTSLHNDVLLCSSLQLHMQPGRTTCDRQ
eukprot:c5629_g1_i1.p2 GENE.c5629_g1_i1~~c5629_g1_i1.p2  ORF type:complete len:136 (-),score=15.76 c5629_g1_i1:337-744(-)